MMNLLDKPDAPLPPLLRCPFCGSPARLEISDTPDFSGAGSVGKHYSVECTSRPIVRCSMGKHWLTGSAQAAVAAWNRRTP
jgi:hypothetical protein